MSHKPFSPIRKNSALIFFLFFFTLASSAQSPELVGTSWEVTIIDKRLTSNKWAMQYSFAENGKVVLTVQFLNAPPQQTTMDYDGTWRTQMSMPVIEAGTFYGKYSVDSGLIRIEFPDHIILAEAKGSTLEGTTKSAKSGNSVAWAAQRIAMGAGSASDSARKSSTTAGDLISRGKQLRSAGRFKDAILIFTEALSLTLSDSERKIVYGYRGLARYESNDIGGFYHDIEFFDKNYSKKQRGSDGIISRDLGDFTPKSADEKFLEKAVFIYVVALDVLENRDSICSEPEVRGYPDTYVEDPEFDSADLALLSNVTTKRVCVEFAKLPTVKTINALPGTYNAKTFETSRAVFGRGIDQRNAEMTIVIEHIDLRGRIKGYAIRTMTSVSRLSGTRRYNSKYLFVGTMNNQNVIELEGTGGAIRTGRRLFFLTAQFTGSGLRNGQFVLEESIKGSF